MRERLKDLPRVRLHDFRHSHATQLLAAGVPAQIVQEGLGHSTVAFTLDRYGSVTPTMQEKAVESLDAAFGRGSRSGTRTFVQLCTVASRRDE